MTKPLLWLTKMSQQEKGVSNRVTDLATNVIAYLVYKVRKENSIIIPRVRITIWLPRENGETMQIERETMVDIEGFEAEYQKTEKKK